MLWLIVVEKLPFSEYTQLVAFADYCKIEPFRASRVLLNKKRATRCAPLSLPVATTLRLENRPLALEVRERKIASGKLWVE